MRKIFSCLLLLFPLMTHADDTAFGGSGALPIPIDQAHVRMVSEQITITGLDIDNPDMKGAWQYSCDYVFRNLTNQRLNFTMGFPFPIYEQDSNITTPTGKEVQLGDPLVYSFAVTVNGKPIVATRTKIGANLGKKLFYKDAYLWAMQLEPLQTVTIHHDYMTGITTDVLGYQRVAFVLKTGGLWQGNSIGHVQISIQPNTPTRLCSELSKHPKWYVTTPPGMHIVGQAAARKYVWDIQDLQPKQDVELCIQTAKDYVHYSIVNKILGMSDDTAFKFSNLNKAQLRFLRNAIYAQHGKRFIDPSLQQLFDKQWWYQANDRFTDAMLSDDDKKALAMIKNVENRQ